MRLFFIHVDLKSGDEKTDFAIIFVEREGEPVVIGSPRWEKG